MTAPFTGQDNYVPRSDVPGHVFTRTASLRMSSYGVAISCSCGESFDWVPLAAATGVENRHRIDVAPATTDEEPNTMNLRDRNLRIAALKAVVDWAGEVLAEERTAHRDDLIARYDEEGTKSFDVKLPDGTKVATISLSIPKDSTDVTDTAALLAWAEENAPDMVDVVERPAVAAYTTRELNRKRITELLARVKHDNGVVVDTATGLVVDGLTHKPGGDPKSYAVKYTDDGREAIGRALAAGDLEHLAEGSPLQLLGGAR